MRAALPMFVLAALLAAGTGVARAGEWVAGTLDSAVLGRPFAWTAYVPDAWRADGPALPVLWLLHGGNDDETTWARRGGIVETMDGLIRRGTVRPMLVVMPGAPRSWWADTTAGRVQTALLDELRPHVEARFHASTRRGDRAIAGISMGGAGALRLALRHPTLFCAAGLLSPAVYEPEPPASSTSRQAPAFQRDGAFDPARWAAIAWTAALPAYAAQPLRVPLWIGAGDDDRFGIAPLAMQLYTRVRPLQSGAAELRIIDGDHDWLTFREMLPDALRYVDTRCRATP